jgi:hypothetical protein
MTEIAALVLVVLFAAQVVGTVTYLFLVGRLFSRLENEHAIVHESLGSPSLFLNNSIQNNTRVLRWLWRREFEELGDPETVASASVVRTLLVALSVNFAALLLVFFGLGATFHA